MTCKSVTKDELLALAKSRGFELSEMKLARWHRKGLLPRPEQRHLGKGKGTESVYPQEAAGQLLALLEFHRTSKKMNHVAWNLWWAGYPVDMTGVREVLMGTAKNVARVVSMMRTADRFGLSQKALEWIDGVDSIRLPKMLEGVRRRLGGDDFEVFTETIVKVAAGVFDGFPKDASESIRSAEKQFEAAYYLDRARSDSIGETAPWLTGDENEIEGHLFSLSQMIGLTDWVAVASTADEVRLKEVRDQVKSFTYTIAGFTTIAEAAFGRNAFGFGTILRSLPRMLKDVDGQAFMLLALLQMSDHPEIKTGIETWAQSAEDWKNNGEHSIRILRTLSEAFPDHKELLSPETIVRAQNDPAVRTKLQTQMEQFRHDHKEELDKFFADHSEVLSSRSE